MTLALIHVQTAIAIAVGWFLIALLAGTFTGKLLRGPQDDETARMRAERDAENQRVSVHWQQHLREQEARARRVQEIKAAVNERARRAA